jgi:hypothetical protein
MGGAVLGSLIGSGADVLGGLGLDQCLEHQGEPLADQVEVPPARSASNSSDRADLLRAIVANSLV